ncbi:MAG: NUDIX domain-containing protein [Prevotellaceae bacterium]|jgi:mutator protein MutT|nr:NUDIX domain-containing protein [Prevotellaceae bacterium]
MRFSLLYKYCPVCGSSDFKENNVKSKKCGQCGFVYYINASAAVAAFIVNEAGELLVCRRVKDPAKGSWDLTGGFVDENETAEEAIVREVNEELGAKVTEVRFLFSLPNEYEYSGLTIPTLDMFFKCKLESCDNLTASDDVAECFFVPLNDLNIEQFGLKSIRKAISLFRLNFI